MVFLSNLLRSQRQVSGHRQSHRGQNAGQDDGAGGDTARNPASRTQFANNLIMLYDSVDVYGDTQQDERNSRPGRNSPGMNRQVNFRRLNLSQKKSESRDGESNSHQSQSRAYPCQKCSLCGKIDSWIFFRTVLHAPAPRLGMAEKLFQRLPIVGFPSFGQTFRLALRESALIKNNLGAGAVVGQFESHNRIIPRSPACAPCLYDPLVWHKFKLAAGDVPSKQYEGAARFLADFCRLHAGRHAGTHRIAQNGHFMKLPGIGQRFVHAFPARCEHRFLMNRFRRTRNSFVARSPRVNWR